MRLSNLLSLLCDISVKTRDLGKIGKIVAQNIAYFGQITDKRQVFLSLYKVFNHRILV